MLKKSHRTLVHNIFPIRWNRWIGAGYADTATFVKAADRNRVAKGDLLHKALDIVVAVGAQITHVKVKIYLRIGFRCKRVHINLNGSA